MEKISTLDYVGENKKSKKKTNIKRVWEDEDDETDSKDYLGKNKKSKKKTNIKPVWEDEDDKTDSNKEHKKLLRQKYVGIVGNPKWAKITEDEFKKSADGEEEDIDLLKYSGNLVRPRKGVNLAKGLIGIKKLHNLNLSTSSCGKIVKSVEFHPTSSLALIAGISGRASVVQVDGFSNEKLQSVKFQKFAIDCAHFTVDGKQFVVGSRTQRNFYCYDLMEGRSMFVPVHHNIGLTRMDNFCMSPDGKLIASCGKFGEIHLFTAKTKEWVTTLKMNGAVTALTFTSDGKKMYSFGENGEICEWDMSSRTCIKKFMDDGCLQGTSLALSGDDNYLAAGSSSGVVNLYKLQGGSINPKPEKTILNLVTAVTKLSFNKSSDILAMASNLKNDAVKLLHVPSKTVFSNFPTTSDNVGKVNCIDFSPNGGYLGLSNNKAEALLYRLTHFENY